MADFIKDTLKAIPGVDPRVEQRMQGFNGLNDGECLPTASMNALSRSWFIGPAATAARIAGLVQKEDLIDDSPY